MPNQEISTIEFEEVGLDHEQGRQKISSFLGLEFDISSPGKKMILRDSDHHEVGWFKNGENGLVIKADQYKVLKIIETQGLPLRKL